MADTNILNATVPTLPVELVEALESFSANRPEWPMQRIYASALALFLLQSGGCDRSVVQIYLDAQFGKKEP